MLRTLIWKSSFNPRDEHAPLGVQWITASVDSHNERL